LEVIVHATLSEKEDENVFVAVDIDSQRTQTPATVPTTSRKQWPFQQHVMGYSHLLLLTVGAGGGYLLGIFLANFFALDQTWRFEYVSLLQLFLAVLFDAILVAAGMSRSFCHQSTAYSIKEKDIHHDELAPPKRVYQQFSSVSVEDEIEVYEHELNVVLGCRPDLETILVNMKDWCEKNDSSSVGVSVCGPDQLIKQVMKACRTASTSSLPFVVDEETFEW
jgi:hypothetical protein